MQQVLGWIILILPGILIAGQIISSIDFSLAQKLGLQEAPEMTDPLLQRAERYTAYWDLLTLVWLPIAGALMIVDHPLWPLIGLVGAAIYLDAAGREAAKILSFKHEGIRVGPPRQSRIFFSTYFIMAARGVIVIALSVGHLLNAVS